jgi:hypothetical protein
MITEKMELIAKLPFALSRGIVRDITSDGTIMVYSNSDHDILPCDYLISENGETHIQIGTEVLYAMPDYSHGGNRGIVLGRIGVLSPIEPSKLENQKVEKNKLEKICAEKIEIIADNGLVLRCGEGSVSFAKDGTVVIRGARILSRSKGVNKIKGAAVQIN